MLSKGKHLAFSGCYTSGFFGYRRRHAGAKKGEFGRQTARERFTATRQCTVRDFGDFSFLAIRKILRILEEKN
jgi:hypothetical protein